MATLTVYPEPGTTVDGFVAWGGSEETFSNARSAAGTSNAYTNTSDIVPLIRTAATTDLWNLFRRGIFLFTTSALTGEAVISSAVFSVYVNTKQDDFGGGALSMVTSTPASNTTLDNADYGNLGTTKQATDVNIADITTSAYNDWTLNATGIGNISLTAITKFGLRITADNDNSSPTWGADNQRQQTNITLSDNAGTTQDPKLVITYTLGGGSGPSKLTLLGVG